jgi:hypothetical protein
VLQSNSGCRSNADDCPPADCPNSRSWASVAKDHSAQFIAKPLRFLWVGGVAETLCKSEKLLLLTLLSRDTVSMSSTSIRLELSLRYLLFRAGFRFNYPRNQISKPIKLRNWSVGRVGQLRTSQKI